MLEIRFIIFQIRGALKYQVINITANSAILRTKKEALKFSSDNKKTLIANIYKLLRVFYCKRN